MPPVIYSSPSYLSRIVEIFYSVIRLKSQKFQRQKQLKSPTISFLSIQAYQNDKKGKREGHKEERKDGIQSLIATVKELSATPTQAVEQLMKRYSLTEAEAHAAVQANW